MRLAGAPVADWLVAAGTTRPLRRRTWGLGVRGGEGEVGGGGGGALTMGKRATVRGHCSLFVLWLAAWTDLREGK